MPKKHRLVVHSLQQHRLHTVFVLLRLKHIRNKVQTSSNTSSVESLINRKATCRLWRQGLFTEYNFIRSLKYRPTFYKMPIQLTTYSGSPVKVLGTVTLNVKYGSIIARQFPFRVIQKGGNIRGVDLFDALRFTIYTPGKSSTIASIQASDVARSILNNWQPWQSNSNM